MYSKIKIAGHPVHPMLVAYPVAFYTATFVCYIIFNSKQDPFWFRTAYIANAAGVIMALVAALPGFIDWALGIPQKTKVKSTGLKHMLCNVAALLLFAFNWYGHSGQWNSPMPDSSGAIALSGAGLILTIIAGFLGWQLVQRHHVGVDPLTPDEIEASTHEADMAIH